MVLKSLSEMGWYLEETMYEAYLLQMDRANA